MDMDYGRFTGHPADPHTAPPSNFALDIAADDIASMAGHWASFIADFATEDLTRVKTWAIKPEDVVDHDAATQLVLALIGTNEQAAAARMYLQQAFFDHHEEAIHELANRCDDAHSTAHDEYPWEAA
jgi:hypothetical protein